MKSSPKHNSEGSSSFLKAHFAMNTRVARVSQDFQGYQLPY